MIRDKMYLFVVLFLGNWFPIKLQLVAESSSIKGERKGEYIGAKNPKKCKLHQFTNFTFAMTGRAIEVPSKYFLS